MGMVEGVEIGNFKSLVGFKLPMSKFNCLVGMNGSGKSTVLQAFGFLSSFMSPGGIDGWLDARGWQAADLKCKLPSERRPAMTFAVDYRSQDGCLLKWAGAFSYDSRRCTAESVTERATGGAAKELLSVKDGSYLLNFKRALDRDGEERAKIPFEYQGSILSQLKDSIIAELPRLAELKKFVSGIKSLELLSPHLLKRNSRGSDDIGIGGERFPSWLMSLENKHGAIRKEIAGFYKSFEDYKVRSTRGGVHKLAVKEKGEKENDASFDAPHVNDGLMRVMAILSQLHADRSLLLFDEIENGINSELFKKLTDVFLASERQIVVTTHSPMVLNYLPDEDAKKSVVFLYKHNGITRAKPFFAMPSVARKLEFMGPGEVYVDTKLEELIENILKEGAP